MTSRNRRVQKHLRNSLSHAFALRRRVLLASPCSLWLVPYPPTRPNWVVSFPSSDPEVFTSILESLIGVYINLNCTIWPTS
ncbi:unnamed protein product [Caretta caretta]